MRVGGTIGFMSFLSIAPFTGLMYNGNMFKYTCTNLKLKINFARYYMEYSWDITIYYDTN